MSRYISHYAGSGKAFYESKEAKKINITDKITVITTATPNIVEKCKLLTQNEKIVNCAKDFKNKEWKMPYKIALIKKALEEAQTEICLILDASDVIVNKDIDDDFIEIFKSYNMPTIYGSSMIKFPKMEIESAKILANPKYKHGGIMFNRLNAGCCVGYKDKLIEVYDKAQKLYEKEPTQTSEQYFIRKVRNKNPTLIDLDYKRELIENIHLYDEEFWKCEECE